MYIVEFKNSELGEKVTAKFNDFRKAQKLYITAFIGRGILSDVTWIEESGSIIDAETGEVMAYFTRP